MIDSVELLKAWNVRGGEERAKWSHTISGPSVAAVAGRISAVPHSFLDPRLSVAALAGDVLAEPLACIPYAEYESVRQGAAIGLWLVASETLMEPLVPALRDGTVALAVDALALRLAAVTDPLSWLSDDERLLEAARTFLLWCGYLPADEDRGTARALLEACDSLAKNHALAEAYEAHKQRDKIARQLANARAREAAARYSSE